MRGLCCCSAVSFFRSDTRSGFLLVFICCLRGFFVFFISAISSKPCPLKCGRRILTVSAVAREYPEIYSDYSRVEVDITSDNAPGLRAYVYSLPQGSVFPEIAPGEYA